MTSIPPVTERERQLEEELATLTQMYEVSVRMRAKDAKKINDLESEVARLRLYEPAQRAKVTPRQEAIAEADLAYWGIGE